MLTQQTHTHLRHRHCVQGVAAHKGGAGGVGGNPVEHYAHPAYPQPGLIHQVVGVGVGLDGGVHPL